MDGHPTPGTRRQLVVAFPLGADAVAVLAERLGGDFALRDIRAEGPAADIVLAPPCSPQAIGHLKGQYPGAALVIVELDDLLRNVRLGGPVSRSLDAGADAYYVAPSTEALGEFLSALPLAGREAIVAMDQPVALPPARASDASLVLERLREVATPEPARAPDRAPDP